MSEPAILLVEDNSYDEALALEAFRQNGINDGVIQVARDGQEAIDYLMNVASKPTRHLPKLVLLDLKLSKLNGFDVLKAIRADERTKLVPVIMYSSSCLEQDILESYRHGANSYLCKPVDFKDYSELIKQLECYWLRWNMTVPPQRRK